MAQQSKTQPDLLIPIFDDSKKINEIPFVRLSYQWFTDHPVPDTFFRMIYVTETGFILNMKSNEPNPLARYTQTDDPVYTDSCMEFFADFFPVSQEGYINFEMNPNGAILCQLGPGRSKRSPVRKLGIEPPKPVVSLTAEGWNLSLMIPLAFINDIYGRSDFGAGSQIYANFYKCGDDLPEPHFGSWHHLGDKPTNFHQPETFGVLELVIG